MTPRNFVYLAIAAALSVLFAVVSFASNNQWSTGRAAGAKLLPTLVSDASQIATIEDRQGDNTMVLERAGGSWGLKNRGNYAADPSKVRTLLVGLAEADLIESKTRRPDRYAALELEDPADKSAGYIACAPVALLSTLVLRRAAGVKCSPVGACESSRLTMDR